MRSSTSQISIAGLKRSVCFLRSWGVRVHYQQAVKAHVPGEGRARTPCATVLQCYHRFMARKIGRFVTTKTVKKPARTKFKTKSGKTVSFRSCNKVERKR